MEISPFTRIVGSQEPHPDSRLAAVEVFSVFRPGAVDSPWLHPFVLVHVDGGDGVLGPGLHFPVHLPLGILGLGL